MYFLYLIKQSNKPVACSINSLTTNNFDNFININLFCNNISLYLRNVILLF